MTSISASVAWYTYTQLRCPCLCGVFLYLTPTVTQWRQQVSTPLPSFDQDRFCEIQRGTCMEGRGGDGKFYFEDIVFVSSYVCAINTLIRESALTSLETI